MRYLILCVLYKTVPSNSSSLCSLAKCAQVGQGSKVTVWDNSPTHAGEAELQWLARTFPSVEYRHTPQNVALSSAYNTVIREYFCGNRQELDALVLLDQDSEFSPDFLDKATAAAEVYPDVALFLPLVRANDRIVSPGILYWFKGTSWKNARSGLVRSRFRTAMNSGMIIRSQYLGGQFRGYDQRIRFYGTDDYFCQQYAQTQPWLYVMDVEIQHQLALDRDEELEVKLWRHRSNIHAVVLLNEKGLIRRSACHLYCFLYCAKSALLHRDIRFLKWF